MTEPHDEAKPEAGAGAFDFSAYPPNTVFHERRLGKERRERAAAAAAAAEAAAEAEAEPETEVAAAVGEARSSRQVERREKKERRKRIDPTTFEKQYTDDELEFMNAMQRYKELSCKSFPSYAEVIKVAVGLGYRKRVDDSPPPVFDESSSLMMFTQVELDA